MSRPPATNLLFLALAASLAVSCGTDEDAAQTVGRARFAQVQKVYEQRIAEELRRSDAPAASASPSPSPAPSASPQNPSPSPTATPPAVPASSSPAAGATPVAVVAQASVPPAAGAKPPLATGAAVAASLPLPASGRGTPAPRPASSATPFAPHIRDLKLGTSPLQALAGAPGVPGADGSGLPGATPSASGTATPQPPESDAEAPQVQSVSFAPASVSDGSDAKILVAATDNLSGVEAGSGSLMSPSGKVYIPFSLLLQAPTGTPNGTLVGSFKVPPEAEAGAWRLSSLRIVDKAQNTAVLSSRDNPIVAGAQLTVVSSRNDTEPPVLESIELQPSQVEDGGTVNVYVRASDDKSSVATVRGILANPSRTVQLNFYPKQNPSSGRFEGQVKLPIDSEYGEWGVTLVTLTDGAGNRQTIPSDDERLKGAKVTVVSSSSDTTGPQLVSIRFEPGRVPNDAEKGSAVAITVVATDDISGVKSVDGWIVSPGKNARRAFTLRTTNVPGELRGQTDIPFQAATGSWTIERLTLADNAGNRTIINQGDPALAGATVEVYHP